jgi:hypothetical protein
MHGVRQTTLTGDFVVRLSLARERIEVRVASR